MYLSSRKIQYRRIFFSRTTTILLVGGLLAAMASYYGQIKIGMLISMFMGYALNILVMILPKFRIQLVAILPLMVGAGLIPTIILRMLCYVSQNSAGCQVNSLGAATFGFFAFPAIFIIIPWVFTWVCAPFYQSKRKYQ